MSFDIDGDWDKPKLPLWKTIRLSYATYYNNFPDLLRTSWLWLILIGVLIGGGGWLQWSWIIRTIEELKLSGSRIAPSMPLGVVLPVFAGYLAMFLGTISVQVAWHRRVIIHEDQGFSGSNLATKYLWHFVGIYLLIGLAATLPLFVVSVVGFFGLQQLGPGLPGLSKFIAAIIFATAFVMSGLIMLRLIMLLPARAIGDVTLTFRETWQRTRGNAWRLFWGTIACTFVPIIPLYIALFLGIGSIDHANGFSAAAFARTMATTTIYILCSFLLLPIFVGFLSHAYQHFFEEA